LSGRTVTTTATVVRLLSTAISGECETQAAFLRGGRFCFVVAKKAYDGWSDQLGYVRPSSKESLQLVMELEEKKRPVGRFWISLLAEVPAAVLATEKCSWLADEAIANRIAVIVTAAVAVIVGIWNVIGARPVTAIVTRCRVTRRAEYWAGDDASRDSGSKAALTVSAASKASTSKVSGAGVETATTVVAAMSDSRERWGRRR
jgi:hypothetical protein